MKFFNRYIPLVLGVVCVVAAMKLMENPQPTWAQVFLTLFSFFTGVVSLYDFVRFRNRGNDDDPSRGH